ncbi:hypothetical protein ACIPSE_16365 [Streptomyces sp. NPDC090106]|uniref:hypothetical protein n=1 Tax=Streptomyces sp. NPDC090106 TaxID=3365946 RepID=UPI0037F60451
MTAPHQHTGTGLRLLRAAVFAAVCVVLAAAGHTMASCATVPPWSLAAGFAGVFAVAVSLAGRARSLVGITGLLAAGQTVLHSLFGMGQHATAAATTAAASGTGAAASMSSTSAMSSMGSMGSMGSMSSVSDASLVEQAARLLCGTTAAAISPTQAVRILSEARLYPAASDTHTHAAAAQQTSDGMAGGSLFGLLPSVPMLLGHLLAALAAGWVLRHGDLAVARLSRLSAHGVAEGALVRSLRGALALVRALRAGLPGAPEARAAGLPRTAPPAPAEPRTTALQHTVIRRGPPAAGLVLAA